MRDEKEIFADLSKLCKAPGYVHAIAYFCFRDNWVSYNDNLKAKNTLHLYSMTRLIRTEISTLIGLMIQSSINYVLPSPDILQNYIDQTEKLLDEIHHSLANAWFAGLAADQIIEAGQRPMTSGKVLREAIFYGGESAYSFQYRDFSTKKYFRDDEWLIKHKGFSIQTARDVVHAIGKLQDMKICTRFKDTHKMPPGGWTILPGFSFKTAELAQISGIDSETISAVLNAFSLPKGESNTSFKSLSDFNIANAAPLLRLEDDLFLSLQQYSMVEALYESPFYWMIEDKSYQNKHSENRGLFTEEFCKERLALVFGEQSVYKNVDIFEGNDKIGEIDVLVIWANRIIVVQAKSKRLTLESKKGNDLQINEDFKKSVKKSYSQGLVCAKALGKSQYKLIDSQARVLTIPKGQKEIYIFCVVADHYPALSFQVRQFLAYETTDSIQPPLVLDVFALDSMAEMLPSPLYFLSYVNRRSNYSEKILASHESTILSYHLKCNLWLDDKYDMVQLGDDISADLDVAMAVRRDGITGKRIPGGILTRLKTTTLGRIVDQIEAKPDPGTIDFGFFLLTLSEDTVIELSQGIDKITQLALDDQKNHDMTVGLDTASSGLTFHVNDYPLEMAGSLLQNHCERRKYAQKAATWFGVCISPKNNEIKFGLKLSYNWKQSSRMDFLTRDMPRSGDFSQALAAPSRKHKLGRNDLCPCGSGIKYKKCCLRK